MLASIVHHLSRLLPQPAPTAPRVDEEGSRGGAGWHESSWMLAHGADVIELPPSVAASWFPDTQPSYHGPSEETPRAA